MHLFHNATKRPQPGMTAYALRLTSNVLRLQATLQIHTENALLCRSRYVLSGATQLPNSTLADTRVTRRGKQLVLGDSPFHAVGANVYWLGARSRRLPSLRSRFATYPLRHTGLDENVEPSPSSPSKDRVLEAFAIAAAMGASPYTFTSL